MLVSPATRGRPDMISDVPHFQQDATPAHRADPVPATPGAPFRQRVVIAYDRHESTWDAWYIKDDHQGHEHQQFTNLDVGIAWAKRVRTWVTVVDPHNAFPSDVLS